MTKILKIKQKVNKHWKNTKRHHRVSIYIGVFLLVLLGIISHVSNSSAAAISATGGTVTTINVGGVDYTVHTFTSSGTFDVTTGGDIEYLVVGGGGGVKNDNRAVGGGGGGGVLTGSLTIPAGSHIITVGAGGAGGPASSGATNGSKGEDSSLGSYVTAIGGGTDCASGSPNGGSGGGSSVYSSGACSPGSGTVGQGYDGGSGSTTRMAGGGGGAGAAGDPGGPSSGDGGDGGDGVASDINGTLKYYGGGGGACGYDSSAIIGLGGLGGGADGKYGAPTRSQDGLPNTGGGAGGASRHSSSINAGAGGSGIVIIRYPADSASPPTVDSAVLESSSGTNTTSEDLFTTISSTDSTNDITDWRLGGNSLAALNMPMASNANDYSTYGNNGTVYGATHLTTGCQVGGCYDFDGANDYINVPSTVVSSPTELTISGWIKKENRGGTYECALHHGSSNTIGSSSYWLGVDNSDQITATIGANTGVGWAAGQTSITANYGQWYHVLATWDGAVVKVYVDGTYVKEYALSSYTNLSSPTYIGTAYDGATYMFGGSVDDTLILNRSLSPEQVNQIYQDGVAGHGMQTLVSQETTVGDIYTVNATPNNGTQDGVSVLSNSLEIVDTGGSCSSLTGDTFKVQDALKNSCFEVNASGYGSFLGEVTQSCAAEPVSTDQYFQIKDTTGDSLFWIDKSDCSACIQGTISENQSLTYSSAEIGQFFVKDALGTGLFKVDSSGNLYFKETACYGSTTSLTLKDNLVSVWEFDESSGTTLNDLHGTNNGTISGSPLMGQSGNIGSSFYMDGSNDYIHIPDVGSTEFSISYWVLPPSSSNNSTYDRLMGMTGFYFEIAGDGSDRLRVYDSAWRATSGYIPQSWSNVVLRKNSSHYELFLNGSKVYELDDVRSIPSTADLYLFSNYSGSQAANYYVSQVAYWNAYITDTQISEVYNSGNGYPYSQW